jgi:hypothetical protein
MTRIVRGRTSEILWAFDTSVTAREITFPKDPAVTCSVGALSGAFCLPIKATFWRAPHDAAIAEPAARSSELNSRYPEYITVRWPERLAQSPKQDWRCTIWPKR